MSESNEKESIINMIDNTAAVYSSINSNEIFNDKDQENSVSVFKYLINNLISGENIPEYNEILKSVEQRKIDSKIIELWLEDEIVKESKLLSSIEKGYPEFKEKIDEIHTKYLQNKLKNEAYAKNEENRKNIQEEENLKLAEKIEEEMEQGNFDNVSQLPLLNDNIIELLLKLDGRSLELNNLTSLEDEEAEKLSKYIGPISLNGLKEISYEVARHFSKHMSRLSLNGLIILRDKTAEYLSQHYGNLELINLKEIGTKGIEFLARKNTDELLLPPYIKKLVDQKKFNL
jgi:hypothetical protein